MSRRAWLWLFAVLVFVFLCFVNAIGNGFTNWDDPLYVTDNDLIRGLSASHIKAIFSSFLVGNYHPLTVLSLALDYRLFGLSSSGFHFTNILIHIGNTALVYGVVCLLCRSHQIAILTALLFGIHPIHVESITWTSERKDVLYVFFYLSALAVYLLPSQAHGMRRKYYVASIVFFLCALLSKGQAVTLPVVFLLVDYVKQRPMSSRLLLEKGPFLALSLLFGVIAIVAQRDTGAIPDIPTFSLVERCLFAFYNVLLYVAKLVAPLKLSAFYPYPEKLSWQVYCTLCVAGFVVLTVCWRIVRSANRFLIFGSGFFVINIVLLLQVLPVGASMIAERYTYLSSLGLFFLGAYGSVNILNRTSLGGSSLRFCLISCFAAYAAWLSYTTVQRNKVWRSSESLWSDVLLQFPRVPVAYLNRGSYYQIEGQLDKALADFNAGLALNPDHYDILTNRCDVFRLLGEYDRSLADCSRVIEKMQDHTVAYTNRGITYSMIGRIDKAMADFERAIAIEPNNPKLYSNRGNLYDMSGMFDAAIEDYSHAISLRPDYFTAYFNRAKTKIRRGDLAGAILDFDVSIKSPKLAADSYFYRSQAHKITGNYSQALSDAERAQRLGRRVDAQYLTELAG